ncbi:phage baseplate assembly protein V [Delftia acidovorans]|uniref:Phage baseplate assembly protein V n=1 Tax=Delftia acidovorans TaxID=80866 RepID=A0A7T2W114_DELAC|nr:phage baseplate assembly protein V [Delftia acidovorans]QPS10285.1 phage baseplate assembly protein V [Delftia acidovorans]
MGAMESPVAQTESPYEAARRLENMIRRGTVAAVRLASPARIRVKVGDNTTDWLPWLALRAGGVRGGRHWSPPVVGEQAVVLCQGGDMSQGVALVGLYSDAMPQPSDQAACERMEWDEKNNWQWIAGVLSMTCLEGIRLDVGEGSCTLVMNRDSLHINVGGATLSVTPEIITTNVDIEAMGISLVRHVHGGVRAGDSNTGLPR